MKKFLFSCIFVFIFSAIIGCSQGEETIQGNGSTVREYLFSRGKIVPLEISKADQVFSEATIVYGPPPLKKWSATENTIIWVSGNNPDEQISFFFKLCNN
jgi:hypothetical protein